MRMKRIPHNDPMRMAPGLISPAHVNSTPCIYAIICTGNGNRYIGQSTEAATRKNVHKFWITHSMRYDPANVFFGNTDIISDLQNYGIESFYFDVLERTPIDGTEEERKVREEFWIQKYDPSTLYNKEAKGPNYDPLQQVNPELKYLSELLKSLEISLKEIDERISTEHNFATRQQFRKSSRAHRFDISNTRKLIKNVRRITKIEFSKVQ